jgi:hypothetical protein
MIMYNTLYSIPFQTYYSVHWNQNVIHFMFNDNDMFHVGGKRGKTYQNNLKSSITGFVDHFSVKFSLLSYLNDFEA